MSYSDEVYAWLRAHPGPHSYRDIEAALPHASERQRRGVLSRLIEQGKVARTYEVRVIDHAGTEREFSAERRVALYSAKGKR